MKRSAAVGLAILSGAVTFCQAQYLSLANVRRIYVGKLGNNDDAERFRAVGARELEHAGFGTASQAKDADAILRPRIPCSGSLRTGADDSISTIRLGLSFRGICSFGL